MERPYPNNTLGAGHVCFQVDDVRAAKAELEAKGVEFYSDVNVVDEGPLAGWRWVYFPDPDGLPLELVEVAYADEAARERPPTRTCARAPPSQRYRGSALAGPPARIRRGRTAPGGILMGMEAGADPRASEADGLGRAPAAIRLARGLGVRELARRLDVSPSAISQIETGKIQPSVRTLYALAAEFGSA